MNTLELIKQVYQQIDHLPILSNNHPKTVVRFDSVVVKLWKRQDWKGGVRRFLGLSPAVNEWKLMNRFLDLAIPTPKPYDYCYLPTQFRPYTEAIVMEDLGDLVHCVDYLKSLVRSGDQNQVEQFEQQLIEITKKMVQNQIFDSDHGLVNFVVTEKKELYRIDLEITRQVTIPYLHHRLFAKMIGTLLSSYTFAIQPDTFRTTQFAQKLKKQLNPPKSVLRMAKSHVLQSMKTQYERSHIDTKVDLPF